MYKYIFILVNLVIASVSMAQVPIDGIVAMCDPYPAIEGLPIEPKEFNSTNNLARPVDNGFYEAEGEKIAIYGRLMDKHCVPIGDAKIFIWQANKAGYYQFIFKKPVEGFHSPKWIDPNFTGTGIVNSDNLGRFNFITIKPGAESPLIPSIYVRIEHPALKSFVSKIYLPAKLGQNIIDVGPKGEIKINNIQEIAKISAVQSKEKPNVYMLDITLDQVIPEKSY